MSAGTLDGCHLIHSRPEEARELLIEFSEFIRYAFARQRPYVTLAVTVLRS